MNKKELETFARRAAKDIPSGSERYKVCGGGLQSSPIQHDGTAGAPWNVLDPRALNVAFSTRALQVGCRMFVVVGVAPVMKALLVARINKCDWTVVELFETCIEPLIRTEKSTYSQKQLDEMDRLSEVFDRASQVAAPPGDVTDIYAKFGELSLEKDFSEGALTEAGLRQRGASIQCDVSY